MNMNQDLILDELKILLRHGVDYSLSAREKNISRQYSRDISFCEDHLIDEKGMKRSEILNANDDQLYTLLLDCFEFAQASEVLRLDIIKAIKNRCEKRQNSLF